ncbi:hypothetical protein ACC689_35510, partial [Rhizobium ruizarguesonis]
AERDAGEDCTAGIEARSALLHAEHGAGLDEMAIWENVVLERIASPGFSRHGLVKRKAGMAFAKEIIDGFDVSGGGPSIRTRLLS